MRVRILVLLLACLAGPGCAATAEREAAAIVAADQPVDRLHELMAQRRYYEGFLLWPRVEKALAKTSGRGTLGREYARMISLTAQANPDEWRWIMASPRIQRKMKVDLVVEIGANE